MQIWLLKNFEPFGYSRQVSEIFFKTQKSSSKMKETSHDIFIYILTGVFELPQLQKDLFSQHFISTKKSTRK